MALAGYACVPKYSTDFALPVKAKPNVFDVSVDADWFGT
jgi:hypothetical protein